MIATSLVLDTGAQVLRKRGQLSLLGDYLTLEHLRMSHQLDPDNEPVDGDG